MSLGHPLPRQGAARGPLDPARACDLAAYVAWVQRATGGMADGRAPPAAAAQMLAVRLLSAGRATVSETPPAGLRIVMLGVAAEVSGRHMPALLNAWAEAALLRLSEGMRP